MQSLVLCHITSLPSGKLGPDAFTFIDLLADAGISVWQVLPITLQMNTRVHTHRPVPSQAGSSCATLI